MSPFALRVARNSAANQFSTGSDPIETEEADLQDVPSSVEPLCASRRRTVTLLERGLTPGHGPRERGLARWGSPSGGTGLRARTARERARGGRGRRVDRGT